MSYLSAPATALVAMNCACCGKALVDAPSLAAGMGPICRDKHGFNVDCDAATRMEVNTIVYAIAALPHDPGVQQKLARLFALGFDTLSKRIAKRLKLIGLLQLKLDGDRYELSTATKPNADGVALLRSVPGRSWDHERKVNVFPVTSKTVLFYVLRQVFPGAACEGPKGTFVLEPIKPGEQRPVLAHVSGTTPVAQIKLPIAVEQRGQYLYVTSHYSARANEMFRAIRGRHYEGGAVNRFNLVSRHQLRAALESCFEGHKILWPAGLFAPSTQPEMVA